MRPPRIKLEGDTTEAARWISWSKSRLNLLRQEMTLGGLSQKWWPKISLASVDIFISASFEDSFIRIIGKADGDILFVGDSVSWFYEYYADIGHKRSGLKSFDSSTLVLKTWFDAFSQVSGWRTTGGLGDYRRLQGVSYYKGRVYTVNEDGWMDVFTESGEHISEVSLWSKVNPVGGRSQNYIHVRADRIFVSANYLEAFYRVYEFDMDYNYVRNFLSSYGPLPPASWGSTKIAVDTVNNRLYIAVNGYWVGELFKINVFNLETGAYIKTLPKAGIEDILCGGLAIYDGILYVSETVSQKIIRYTLATSTILDVIDCSVFLPSLLMLRAVAVNKDGIYITAVNKDPPAPPVYLKKLTSDGLREIKSVGEYIGEGYPGTAPASPYRFSGPYWMDMKSTENP